MSQHRLLVCITVTVIVCAIGIGLCLFSVSAAEPLPRDVISGFVLDENGKPVVGANVTLWLNGQLWQPGPQAYPESANPLTTSGQDDRTGMFSFGLVAPGQYAVTAEKYGFKDTIYVNISNDSLLYPLKVNITLAGFDVRLSREQLSNFGTVVVTIRTLDGDSFTGINVSLWREGRQVDITGNPQIVSYQYVFKHLPPGQYEVDVYGIHDNQTVNVNNNTVPVNFTFPIQRPPGTPRPSPSTNSVDTLLVLSSIGVATVLVGIRNRTR